MIDSSTGAGSARVPHGVAHGSRRTRVLLLLLAFNLVALSGLWCLVIAGLGSRWMALGYDLVMILAASITIGQYVVLALWSALQEPRPPLHWLGHVILCGLAAAAIALAYFPAGMFRFVGGRFGLTWGQLFWEAYITFMLVLCAGVAFLLAADIALWPARRMLGCKVAFGDQPASTPAARGFGLTEMFWWVGMAAAGCWLLRSILENVLAENLTVVLFLTLCVIPVALPAGMAALAETRRRRALFIWLAWVLGYASILALALWLFSTINRSPRNPILAYIAFFPPEITIVATFAAALTTYFNTLALHWIGARLVWNMPAFHPAAGRSRRALP